MGTFDFLTKNPSILALAALGIGLFIFRDKISGFFSDITGGVQGTAQIAQLGGTLGSNLQGNLTGIQDILSGKIFEGIKLPSFELPTAQGDQGSLFGAGQQVGGFFSGITDFFNSLLNPLPEAGGEIAIPIAPIPAPDISIPVAPSIAPTVIAPFQGGGISFEGGQIFETPIENLSLSQILNMGLAETASGAANIKAIAEGFTPEETAFLNQGSPDVGGLIAGGPPQTSDPQFQGLTPEQIFQQLVGGVISNF